MPSTAADAGRDAGVEETELKTGRHRVKRRCGCCFSCVEVITGGFDNKLCEASVVTIVTRSVVAEVDVRVVEAVTAASAEASTTASAVLPAT